MWAVNYLHEKYRKANPDEIKSFEKQSCDERNPKGF
jgi:hypothetical protein